MEKEERKKILQMLSTAKSFANKAYNHTGNDGFAAEVEDCMDYINRVQHMVRRIKPDE